MVADPHIRASQEWLNRTYSHRSSFPLVPTDGVRSRALLTALLFAIQYDIGMNDSTANGNFGPGTRTGLRASAGVRIGSSDGAHHFVTILHAAMILNSLAVDLGGTFTSTTQARLREFQSFMEIPATGQGDYTTWCTLLVSCGDTSVPTKGLDTSRQLSAPNWDQAKSRGYTHAGRYLVNANQFLTGNEIASLKSTGIRLVPIMQRLNTGDAHMHASAGRQHATEAAARARTLGPAGRQHHLLRRGLRRRAAVHRQPRHPLLPGSRRRVREPARPLYRSACTEHETSAST